MGRQWNEIIQSLGGLTGGTISINANLTDIDALLTTLQADVADGIIATDLRVDLGETYGTQGIGQWMTGPDVGGVRSVAYHKNLDDEFSTVSNSNPLTVVGSRGNLSNGTLTASVTNGTLFPLNNSRKYLLIQCTSGTAYIDTNGTATTADGIQLTSGQGLVFENSFVPTGPISAITSAGTARLIGRQG
jgi:hypothetical protein